jgi:hypothetical protein
MAPHTVILAYALSNHAIQGMLTVTMVIQTVVKQIQTLIRTTVILVGMHVRQPVAPHHVLMEFVPSHAIIPMLIVTMMHLQVPTQMVVRRI